jgi:sulfate adenylyltransferase subunit 1
MPWYDGQILEHLEALEPADVYERDKRVFQTVVRPKRQNTMISGDMQVNIW